MSKIKGIAAVMSSALLLSALGILTLDGCGSGEEVFDDGNMRVENLAYFEQAVTGSPIITQFPVNARHNTGWDSSSLNFHQT